jgi:hypothetical protein
MNSVQLEDLKKMMFAMKEEWENGSFDGYYRSILMGEPTYTESDIPAMEQYIQMNAFGNPNPGPMNIMLGFLYGEILVRNLPKAKWVFKKNPRSWSDFYVEWKRKGQKFTVLPFSRVVRYGQDETATLGSLLEFGKNVSKK